MNAVHELLLKIPRRDLNTKIRTKNNMYTG
jgi:hypothetical protein